MVAGFAAMGTVGASADVGAGVGAGVGAVAGVVVADRLGDACPGLAEGVTFVLNCLITSCFEVMMMLECGM